MENLTRVVTLTDCDIYTTQSLELTEPIDMAEQCKAGFTTKSQYFVLDSINKKRLNVTFWDAHTQCGEWITSSEI